MGSIFSWRIVCARDRPKPLHNVPALFEGTDCVNSPQYSAVLRPQGTIVVFDGSPVTLNCSTNIPTPSPSLWEINDELFPVTLLPPEFTANGSILQFEAVGEVKFRCLFRIFLNGAVVDICSNYTTIQVEGIRGKSIIGT